MISSSIIVTDSWADLSVQAASPQVARLPLLSARPAVIFPAEDRYHPSTSTKLYCLVT